MRTVRPVVSTQPAVDGTLQLVRGTGFGLLGDIIIGIIGAFIGAWLLPKLGIHIGAGIVSAIVSATIGAVVLLLVLGFFRTSRRRW